ncbi:MAG TPA: c-type cytochrome [Vicinamibacterales bacterium]
MRSARALLRLGLVTCGCALAISGLWRSARAAQPAATATPLQAGKALYEQRCAYCHGSSGRGDGPVAADLYPRPVDFTAGKFKLRTTESGSLPTDDDLNRTILEGIPGTSMPGWRGRLSIDDVRNVVTYLKSFSPRFASEAPQPIVEAKRAAEPASSSASGQAAARTPQNIARGQAAYARLGCAACHGADGRGTDAIASGLTDDWNRAIEATDLTEPWTFRGGPSARDVYVRLRTGMSGTPMPSFASAAPEDELWDLARYVTSLARPPIWRMTAAELAVFYGQQGQAWREDPVARGRDLVNTLSCAACHSPVREDGSRIEELHLAGGMRFRLNPFGDFVSANLTSDPQTGLGAVTDEQVKRALTRGIRRDGSRMLPYAMPWASYASLTQDDQRALVAYLRTLRPVANRIPGPTRPALPVYLWAKFRMLILGIDLPASVYPGNAGTRP